MSHFDHSGKLHWRDAKASDKQRICQVIAKHPGTHVIIEALPLSPHVRDERARQHALSSTLLSLTHDYGVTRLVLERRDAAQDDKDRANAAVAS